MVMTEKQGGSDLRANTTVAEPVGDGWYELTGHKWFCTHPVFERLLHARADRRGGITCFVAERPHPGFRIQRLKDKLGGRCLASSEVEYDRLPARILGEEGRGTAFMIEQIIWTRLDTMIGRRRDDAPRAWPRRSGTPPPRAPSARRSPTSPRWRNVLADLALESEAAMAPRHAHRARLRRGRRRAEVAFRRLALAVMKYWICKRGAPLAAEALECLGGNGYVEEAPMAQFYRDIQIGTVWEGSGNVIALDVLRAMAREPEGAARVPGRVRARRRRRSALRRAPRAATARPPRRLRRRTSPQWVARRARRGPRARACRRACSCATRRRAVADAFCAGRLAPTATSRSERSRAAWTARRSSSARWRSDTQA